MSICFAQLEERESQIALREKQIGSRNTYKKTVQKLRKQHFEKLNRRRNIPNEITQTNLSSAPSSPSIYVDLDNHSNNGTSESNFKIYSKRKSHRRVGSTENRQQKNGKTRSQETQTDVIEKEGLKTTQKVFNSQEPLRRRIEIMQKILYVCV